MKKLGKETNTQDILVDQYIRNLENLGISLKSLKLLGNIEYKPGDAKLTEKELVEKILTDSAYKNQKEILEKYIGEFLKADLITQSIHRRRGTELVNPKNDNWIDGGVYLYRTKQSTDISGALKVDGDAEEYIRQIGNEDYVQMQYVTEEKWEELKNSNDKKIRYRYTLDEDGNVVIAKVKTIETVEGDISNSVNTWFEDTLAWTNEKFGIGADSTEVIVEGEEHIDYKSYISKYTMPYEFLVNLCEITGSPEFVYHVAMLARETEIDLVVQDDSTIEKAISEVEEKYETYENIKDNQTSGSTKINDFNTKKRRLTITTTTDPHLEIEYANTWSFYEKYVYTKNTEINTEQNGPITESIALPSTLSKHQEERVVTEIYQGLEEEKTLPERWYDTFLVEATTSTQTTTTVTTYNPGILENSVEKSKQFLGLLRNKDGKCYYDDCYKNPHRAEICAEEAEFVKEGGKNVGYQKPNSSKDEDKPLNELLNKEHMLYAILGENIEGDESANAEEDSASEYKVKMQGLIDHMKYLMTFPDNEDVDDYSNDIDDPIEDEEYEELNVDDLIVKTDEEGALRPVTLDELIGIINVTFSGKEKQNATSIANTIVDCQDKYNVNAVFVLAFAHQESSIGTANSKWVKQNNWLSWDLGTSFSSPQNNVETVMSSIAKGGNYFTQGKITIKDIGLTYCPNLPDYPTQGDDWVRNVTSYVKKMYAHLGIEISGTEGDYYSSGYEDNTGGYTVNGKTYKNFKQDSGSPWSSNSFAGGTMQNSGCSITSIAIILSGYGQNVTPEDIRREVNGKTPNLPNLLNKHGISNSRPGTALTAEQIKSHLKSGKPIIANVEGEWTSSSGHYMVLLDYKNENGKDYVYVSNPGTVNSTKNGWVELSRVSNNMKTQSILIN